MTTQFPIWVEQCEIKIYPRICKIVRNCATSLKSLSSAFFLRQRFFISQFNTFVEFKLPSVLMSRMINALTRINVTIFVLDFFKIYVSQFHQLKFHDNKISVFQMLGLQRRNGSKNFMYTAHINFIK